MSETAIRESGEMYLESILVLSKKNDTVRSVDISRYLSYSKPSVSIALSGLKAAGHVTVDEHGHIFLTESGRTIAEKIYERHRVLTDMLTALGVGEDVASSDACKIEHVISDESFEAIKKHFLK